MPIGFCHGQADRYAVGFGQQAAFDAALGAVGGIGSRFFPRPAALSSAPHPYLTSASPLPALQRTAGPGCGVCLRQSDAGSPVGAGPALSPPTTHLTLEIRSSLDLPGSVSAAFVSASWKA